MYPPGLLLISFMNNIRMIKILGPCSGSRLDILHVEFKMAHMRSGSISNLAPDNFRCLEIQIS